MSRYINVNDDIIGKRVIYNDREFGIVLRKISEGNDRKGADYEVRLESGATVYITDCSFSKFKLLESI